MLAQYTASPRTAAATPPPATIPSPTTLDPAVLTRAVSDYYALLPSRPDDAWTRLGPALQAQGYTAYRTYWSTITSLSITTPPQATSSTVSIGITLTLANGTTISETHHLGLIPANPTPLINTDTVISSETSTPPPPTTQDKKDQDQAEKKDREDRKGEEDKRGETEKKGEDG